MKPIFFLTLILFASFTTLAQDDSAARENYLRAETAYLEGRWSESLEHLQQAEKLLGRKTPKVQLLTVLVYEKLALEHIDALTPALAEIHAYLGMQNQLNTTHQRYIPVVRQIQEQLPGQAQARHDARLQAQYLAEKLAWQEESAKRRIGLSIALPSKDWMGTEFGIVLGSRSRMWVAAISSTIGRDIVMDDEWNARLAERLAGKPDDYVLRSTHFHIAYLQGIRVLPRERDFIKPFVGVKGILQDNNTRTYHADSETGVQPDRETLDNIRKYGLDPADFFTAKTKTSLGVSVDILVGAMVHLRNTTFFAGLDVLNSHKLQFGASFKLSR